MNTITIIGALGALLLTLYLVERHRRKRHVSVHLSPEPYKTIRGEYDRASNRIKLTLSDAEQQTILFIPTGRNIFDRWGRFTLQCDNQDTLRRLHQAIDVAHRQAEEVEHRAHADQHRYKLILPGDEYDTRAIRAIDDTSVSELYISYKSGRAITMLFRHELPILDKKNSVSLEIDGNRAHQAMCDLLEEYQSWYLEKTN